LQNGYEPPVTFVVVQKRHHTRLFPDNPQDECGRGKNVPPGTVVDSTIVHPVENDFFLVSHQGIQVCLFIIFSNIKICINVIAVDREQADLPIIMSCGMTAKCLLTNCRK